MLLRGHAVLELSADDLRAPPDVGDEIDASRVESAFSRLPGALATEPRWRRRASEGDIREVQR